MVFLKSLSCLVCSHASMLKISDSNVNGDDYDNNDNNNDNNYPQTLHFKHRFTTN